MAHLKWVMPLPWLPAGPHHLRLYVRQRRFIEGGTEQY